MKYLRNDHSHYKSEGMLMYYVCHCNSLNIMYTHTVTLANKLTFLFFVSINQQELDMVGAYCHPYALNGQKISLSVGDITVLIFGKGQKISLSVGDITVLIFGKGINETLFFVA
jgi:hypothetical protein